MMGHSKTQISLEKTLKKYEWEKRILLFIAEKKDIELIRNVNSFFNDKTCLYRAFRGKRWKKQLKIHMIPISSICKITLNLV